jgi:hypothetical protein
MCDKHINDNTPDTETTSKTVRCPVCYYHDALLEASGYIYCPYCESGLADLDD